jgi:hypothetical protein
MAFLCTTYLVFTPSRSPPFSTLLKQKQKETTYFFSFLHPPFFPFHFHSYSSSLSPSLSAAPSINSGANPSRRSPIAYALS